MKEKPLEVDSALYFLAWEGVLKGCSGSYVDELLHCGTKDFRALSKGKNRNFKVKEESALPSKFTGFVLDKEQGKFCGDQISYLRRL